MEQKKGLPCLAIVLLLAAGTLWGQTAPAAQPRLTPTSFAVELGNTPPPLSVSMLIRASLELSGAGPALVRKDTALLDRMVAEAKRAVAPYHSAYERGNVLLVFMHKHFLTYYSEPQAKMDTLLRTGVFNCVSSAVLYMILGRAVGLDVEGVYTPDHAFCTVRARGRLIDVETTNRYGFDPGTKTAFRTAFGETGFVYVPPGDYRLRTPTNGKGLLSFILQDRISLLERSSSFRAAFGLAVDRYAVLHTKTALRDLANEATNYCALLNAQEGYGPAITFLESVEQRYGRAPRLEQVMVELLHNQVLALSGAGRYGQALKLIADHRHAGQLDAAAVSSLKRIVVQRQLEVAAVQQPFRAGLATIENSYRQGEVSESLYRSYLSTLFAREAQRTAGAKGYLAAIKVLDRGIALTGGNSQLEQGRRIYRDNYVATVHNRFASYFNAHDYSRATAVIDEGLKNVPNSSVLNKDLQLLARVRGS